MVYALSHLIIINWFLNLNTMPRFCIYWWLYIHILKHLVWSFKVFAEFYFFTSCKTGVLLALDAIGRSAEGDRFLWFGSGDRFCFLKFLFRIPSVLIKHLGAFFQINLCYLITIGWHLRRQLASPQALTSLIESILTEILLGLNIYIIFQGFDQLLLFIFQILRRKFRTDLAHCFLLLLSGGIRCEYIWRVVRSALWSTILASHTRYVIVLDELSLRELIFRSQKLLVWGFWFNPFLIS